MIVRSFSGLIEDKVSQDLERFEKEFSYPLGPNARFSISHGPNYLTFFSAMGPATLLVVERHQRIVGTMVLVQRELVIAESSSGEPSCRKQESHYVCDLKIRPDARSGPALSKLFAAAAEIVGPRDSHACYGIVMAGTSVDPKTYTGRLAIPGFAPIGEIAVLRFPAENSCEPDSRSDGRVESVAQERFNETCERLRPTGVQPSAGNASMRSKMVVRYLRHVDGLACGMLEDTQRGKRLIEESGAEIVSAHLSRFLWSDGAAAVQVIRHAQRACMDMRIPGLFCAMPSREWAVLKPLLAGFECQESAATIYGYQLPSEQNWWVDTSEI